MWANKLRVALALLLVAELGHVRSSPILKKGGSALARSERDVSAGNSNEEEYDYERSYIDDPNYYPDPNEEHSDEDDAGDLARSKRDVFKGNTDEEEYDYERSLKEDPNYYPDYDEYYEDKSYEDDAKDNVDDPNYYPDHDDDHSDDKSHEDDDESYVDDPNYYPDYDEEDKSHEDDAKDHVDDPDYHPDHDDDHSEDKSHEDDDKDYTDDPDYHPDHDDDHSEDKSHEDDDDSYVDDPNYYPDYDEEDKSHEDHAKSVQRRQVKTGNIQQQTGYVKYDVDGAGYDPWRREINQLDGDISFGVEPLRPVQASDVAQGVEAVDGESDDDSYRGWFYNKFANVGDAIEDSFGLVRDKVSGAVVSIHDFAGVAADKIHDTAHSTGTTIVDAYHSLKDRISDLRHRIHHLFSSFGLMVQRGADYCIQHLQHTANQVREAEILDKLQQKLKDGNEQVTAFFTILGEKITSWAKSHGHDNVDQGLILVESHGGDHTDDEGSGNRENLFPNLFQDQDVLDQMNQMVNKGVITQEELDLLYQQTEQVSGPQYNEGTIIESHSRRRHLRSRITVV